MIHAFHSSEPIYSLNYDQKYVKEFAYNLAQFKFKLLLYQINLRCHI